MSNYRPKPYVVSVVPSDMCKGTTETLWYCHRRNYPYIPVFGSIGTKANANKVCKTMNESEGYC